VLRDDRIAVAVLVVKDVVPLVVTDDRCSWAVLPGQDRAASVLGDRQLRSPMTSLASLQVMIWSPTMSRHFYAPDVDLESGALELETGERLGGSFSVESTISARRPK
jgi:hypothetical protein